MASCPSLSDLLHLIWSSLGPSRKCSAFEKQLLIGWSGCVKSWAGGTPLLCGLTGDPRVPGSCSITCVSISGEEQECLGHWVLGLRSSGHDLEVQASVPPTSHQQGLSHTATPGCNGWGWMEPPVFLVVICCCLVANLCPTLCDPVDCITPGFLILNCLPEFAQTHVHWVCDAIQLSHPLLPLLLLPCLSQHRGLLQWVSSSHYVTKGLEL